MEKSPTLSSTCREKLLIPQRSPKPIFGGPCSGDKKAYGGSLPSTFYKEHPENDALAELYANALLDRVLDGESLRLGIFLDDTQKEEVSTARDILTQKWRQVLNGDRYARSDQTTLPLNLLIALRLLGDDHRAVEVANEALHHFPDDQTVKEYSAQILAEQGATDRALELVSDLEPNRTNVGLRFTLACSMENWSSVRDIVNNHISVFPETEREFVAAVGGPCERGNSDDRRKTTAFGKGLRSIPGRCTRRVSSLPGGTHSWIR